MSSGRRCKLRSRQPARGSRGRVETVSGRAALPAPTSGRRQRGRRPPSGPPSSEVRQRHGESQATREGTAA
eukprot:12049891-Alexandrium_andersonii.AAC.1